MDNTAVRIINVFDTIDEFVFALVMLTIPFGWQFSIIPLLLFVTLMLRKTLQDREKPSKEKFFYFLPVFAYFFLLFISLVYSSDPGKGIDLIFRKISILLFAILLLFSKLSPGIVRKGFRFFILGTLLVTVLYFSVGLYHATKIGSGMLCIIPGFEGSQVGLLDTNVRNNYLLAENFSFLIDPAYFAILLGMAIVGVVYVLINEHKSIMIRKIAVPVFVLSSVAMVLLSTNGTLVASLITALALMVLLYRYRVYLDMKKYWMVIAILVLVFGALYHPQFKTLIGLNTESDSVVLKQQINEASWVLIKSNPIFGVGMGDLQTELNAVYKSKEFSNLINTKMNPHNQYVHTWAESGILALLAMLWMFGAMIWYGYKRKSFLMVFYAIVFCSAMFFESTLNRYWGVLFTAIFYTMLYIHSDPEEQSAV